MKLHIFKGQFFSELLTKLPVILDSILWSTQYHVIIGMVGVPHGISSVVQMCKDQTRPDLNADHFVLCVVAANIYQLMQLCMITRQVAAC